MTYHPMGGKTSADYFPDEGWLAFHMLQSGHNYDTPEWREFKPQLLGPSSGCAGLSSVLSSADTSSSDA
jgi:hypothetical protein